jgi:hypothetical protein
VFSAQDFLDYTPSRPEINRPLTRTGGQDGRKENTRQDVAIPIEPDTFLENANVRLFCTRDWLRKRPPPERLPRVPLAPLAEPSAD